MAPLAVALATKRVKGYGSAHTAAKNSTKVSPLIDIKRNILDNTNATVPFVTKVSWKSNILEGICPIGMALPKRTNVNCAGAHFHTDKDLSSTQWIVRKEPMIINSKVHQPDT